MITNFLAQKWVTFPKTSSKKYLAKKFLEKILFFLQNGGPFVNFKSNQSGKRYKNMVF
jgi:hypothetical protein